MDKGKALQNTLTLKKQPVKIGGYADTLSLLNHFVTSYPRIHLVNIL